MVTTLYTRYSQSYSEHLHPDNLSVLALRVVTARVLVILSVSFTSQIDDVKARVVTNMTMVVHGETKGVLVSWKAQRITQCVYSE